MRWWSWFLARTHLSADAVCAMSLGQGAEDFHDWRDTTAPLGSQFYVHSCRRCGKVFYLSSLGPGVEL